MLSLLGPCSIDMDNFSPNGTVWNPYGWNDNANIFFLDQPYVSSNDVLSLLDIQYLEWEWDILTQTMAR